MDANGEISIIFPVIWSGEADVNLLPAQGVRVIPGSQDNFRLTVQEPLGSTEVLIVASSSPMASSLRAMNGLAKSRGQTRGPQGLSRGDSLTVVNDLLGDISSVSQQNSNGCQVITTDALRSETNDLVAFSLSFVATKAKT